MCFPAQSGPKDQMFEVEGQDIHEYSRNVNLCKIEEEFCILFLYYDIIITMTSRISVLECDNWKVIINFLDANIIFKFAVRYIVVQNDYF